MPTPDNFYSFSSRRRRPQSEFALLFASKLATHVKNGLHMGPAPRLPTFPTTKSCNKATRESPGKCSNYISVCVRFWALANLPAASVFPYLVLGIYN